MESKYFFCYDRELAFILRKIHGFEYITKAIHPRTKQLFYLFERTPELNKILDDIFVDRGMPKTL
jgi:hypothetical protein